MFDQSFTPSKLFSAETPGTIIGRYNNEELYLVHSFKKFSSYEICEYILIQRGEERRKLIEIRVDHGGLGPSLYLITDLAFLGLKSVFVEGELDHNPWILDSGQINRVFETQRAEINDAVVPIESNGDISVVFKRQLWLDGNKVKESQIQPILNFFQVTKQNKEARLFLLELHDFLSTHYRIDLIGNLFEENQTVN